MAKAVHSPEIRSAYHDNGSGYTIPFKGGYFPAPPADSLTDFRDEVSETLQDFFEIKVDAHHHEVATAGQCEIQMLFDDLVPAIVPISPATIEAPGVLL